MAKHTEERRIIDMEKNGLLEIIAAHRTGDALDEIMAQDKDYQEALARQQVAFDRLDELELTREQRSTINQAITANNHFGAGYWRGQWQGVVCAVRIPPIPPHTMAKYIDIVQI